MKQESYLYKLSKNDNVIGANLRPVFKLIGLRKLFKHC